jgi:hypothetical protein
VAFEFEPMPRDAGSKQDDSRADAVIAVKRHGEPFFERIDSFDGSLE